MDMISIIAIIFGFVIGSFLNVVIYRLPNMLIAEWIQECREFLMEAGSCQQPMLETCTCSHNKEKATPISLWLPSSHCIHCKTPISIRDNIPIISWCLLKGRCRTCKIKISIRYPLIELSTGLLFLWSIHYHGFNVTGFIFILFSLFLITLSIIDWNTLLLPDSLTQLLLWLGLGIASLGKGFIGAEQAIMGAVLGYLLLWGFARIFFLVTKKVGMGEGDFKLLAAIGGWLGPHALPKIVLVATFFALIYALLAGKKRGESFPFGPWLALGGWTSLLLKTTMIEPIIPFFTRLLQVG